MQMVSLLSQHPSPSTLDVSADTEIGVNDDLLGKKVGDLQQNVAVSGTNVTGESFYVEGYTGYSGDAELQEGNYLALHFASNNPDATLSIELIGGATEGNPRELDSDGYVVFRITSTSQKPKIHATVDGNTVSKTYDLSGLTLDAKQ